MKKTFPFESKLMPGTPVLNVFCFHHAGGTAASYRKWTNEPLPIRIICTELMGKGTRRGEAFVSDSGTLARLLAEQVAIKNAGNRFCLFGHSMGAALAFEICCVLEHQYGLKAEKLIVAGRQAPQDENLSEFKSYMDDEALIQELRRYRLTPDEVLDNQQFLEYYLPEMRRDYQLSESFRYHGETTDVPVIAHAAAEDPGADQTWMEHWQQVTTNQFKLREFAGNHFFVLAEPGYLEALVADILQSE